MRGIRAKGRWSIAFAAVLLWRIIVLAALDGSESAWPLNLARNTMGLTFVACALAVLVKGASHRLFVAYALCAGLHWGGPIAVDSDYGQTILTLFYLTVSGCLASALLFHFALSYPKTERRLSSTVLGLIYVSSVLCAVCLVGAMVTLSGGDSNGFVQAYQLVYFASTTLLGLGSLLSFVIKAIRSSASSRHRLHWMALGSWAGVLPWLVANLYGDEGLAELSTLGFVLIPLSIAAALVHGASPE